jgi:hypothetical protein
LGIIIALSKEEDIYLSRLEESFDIFAIILGKQIH